MVHDNEYQVHTVDRIEASDDGFFLTYKDGWSFFCPKRNGVSPMKGDRVKSWGRGLGFPVRGLQVGDTLVFYETEAEFDARQSREQQERDDAKAKEYAETGKVANDKRISALPPEFRSRIEAFRLHDSTWGPEFEDYELFSCEEAVKIADACKTAEAVREFRKLNWGSQKAKVPNLSDDHSGNTFGAACSLAHLYLSKPELVINQHGALCPLVGCERYGCYAAREPKETTA